ncbi:hypothetical protein G6F56_003462 [Rhizopus delemar]|nr:hypothetical protein G6F56_003462 [Rhizopus delemar]
MNNTQSSTTVCPFCKLFTALTPEPMKEHQRDSTCMASFAAQEFLQLGPFTVSERDMSVSTGGAATPVSDMDVSVGDVESSIHSETANTTSNTEEVHPVIYEHMGSSLNLSESDVFGIKLNNVNNEFQATRAHKRALTNLINDGFGQLLSQMGGLLKAPDTVEKRICACDNGFKVVYFQDICLNGCYLFPADDKNVLPCPISTCQRSRYKRQDEAAEAIERGPLSCVRWSSFGPANDKRRQAATVQIPKNNGAFDEVERIYRDIWDGELVRSMMTEGQRFENKVHCLVMIIDPSNRHTADNMITFTITPSLSKPKDIMSFLKLIIDEIVALGIDGFTVKKDGADIFNEKVHLLGITGDIPGVAELMGHGGHSSLYGCRICLALGFVIGSIPYFPEGDILRSIESLVEGGEFY